MYMDILLYYLLRRIFVRMELTKQCVSLTKGLILRRRSEIPVRSIIKVELRRTVLLRLLRAKRVEISTLSGGVFFYLREGEPLPFLPRYDGAHITARPLQSAAGAFIDTRALSGVVTFALFLNRLGNVFGSDSFSRIMSAMLGAAEGVTNLLAMLHIGVPRVTALMAVFIGAAWLFVFLRKLLAMQRFRLSCQGGYITVRRGILTLYECWLVRDNLTAVLRCDTLTTLLTRAAPLYAHDVLIYPPVSRSAADRILTRLCGLRLPDGEEVRPPLSALFGHCAAPLGWLGAFAAALLVTFIAEPVAADLVQSLLWSGAAVSLWFAGAYAVYMRHSRAARSGGMTGLTFRRGARLYTAVIPDRKIALTVTGRNVFQRFSGMCDITAACAGNKRYKLRNVPYCAIRRLFR